MSVNGNLCVPALQVATGLFDLVSSNSDLDHPLCEECTDALLDLMDTTLSRTQNQAQLCQQLLASLNDMPETDVSALERELENVRSAFVFTHFIFNIIFCSILCCSYLPFPREKHIKGSRLRCSYFISH